VDGGEAPASSVRRTEVRPQILIGIPQTEDLPWPRVAGFFHNKGKGLRAKKGRARNLFRKKGTRKNRSCTLAHIGRKRVRAERKTCANKAPKIEEEVLSKRTEKGSVQKEGKGRQRTGVGG